MRRRKRRTSKHQRPVNGLFKLPCSCEKADQIFQSQGKKIGVMDERGCFFNSKRETSTMSSSWNKATRSTLPQQDIGCHRQVMGGGGGRQLSG